MAARRFTRRMQGNFRALNRTINKTSQAIKGVAQSAIKYGAIGLTALGGAVTGVMRAFSRFENAEAAFTPMLGSARMAKSLVAELNTVVEETPFAFDNLVRSAQSLLSMGVATRQNVIPTMRMLGDLAKGNAVAFENLTINYSEIMATGKAMTKDLRQFTTAGVGMIPHLAKTLGVSSAAVLEMAEDSQISSKMIHNAMVEMTSSGGLFFRAMELGSQTVTGRYNAMMDTIFTATSHIGRALAPAVKLLMEDVTKLAVKLGEWAKANQGIINEQALAFVRKLRDFIPRLIEQGPKIAKFTVYVAALIAALKVLALTMMAVSAAFMITPIGWITIGVVALIAAVASLVYWWKEVKMWFLSFLDAGGHAWFAILGPIGMFAAFAGEVLRKWEPIKAFFVSLGDAISGAFSTVAKFFSGDGTRVPALAGAMLPGGGVGVPGGGFWPGGDAEAEARVQVSSPQERVSRSFEQSKETSELIIRDNTGRGELAGSAAGTGKRSRITLLTTESM